MPAFRDPRFDKLLAYFRGGGNPGAMRDGWSKTGQLITWVGQQEDNQKYTMQADFSQDRGGSGAQYYTVKFGVPNPAPAAQARAEILWKAEGTSIRRLVDVGNGVSVSGTAQACHVSVYDVTALPISNPFKNKPYRVDTIVTPGVRPNDGTPPRLTPFYQDWVINGSGAQADAWFSGTGMEIHSNVALDPFAARAVLLPVPQNAGVVSFRYNAYKVDIASGEIEAILPGDACIDQLFGFAPPYPPGSPQGSGFLDLAANQDVWIPLPSFVNLLRFVMNNTIFTAATKRIGVSDFSFGIEG